MKTSKLQLSLSFWLALGALVLGAWPLFAHLQLLLSYDGIVADAFENNYWTISNFQFKFFVIMPFLEPVTLIAGVLAQMISPKRFVRALPGFLFFGGVISFLLLNLGAAIENELPLGNVWGWTFGDPPESFIYALAILLALLSAIVALMPKGKIGGVGSHPAAGRQPVAFDTNTGQPIYGYDTTTGAPIY